MKENILSDLGKDGEAVLTSALSKYAHQFGNIATNLVTSYQNVDFDNYPDKRREKSSHIFFQLLITIRYLVNQAYLSIIRT